MGKYKINDVVETIFIPIAIVLIVLATYYQVLKADFVIWDDDIIIFRNPRMGPLSISSICSAFTDVESMMRYNPLALISWSATISLFGMNPFGFHLGNWLLHGFSSMILFFLIKRILSYPAKNQTDLQNEEPWRITIIAFIATLLWALHPLRVEPVAWATDRTYCQSLFFLLLSALCYVIANEQASCFKKSLYAKGLSFVFYVLSVFSYSIGITFFAVLLVLDIFLFKRIGGDVGWFKSKAARQVLIEKVLFALPAIAIGIVTVVVRIKSAGVWEPPVPLSEFGLFDRFMQAIYIVAHYVNRHFYTVDLAPVYTTLVEFNPLSFPFLSRAVEVCTVVFLVVVYRRKFPLAMATMLSYIILLIPVMGFFEHPHYPSDRYSLLSSIPLTVFLSFLLLNVKNHKKFICAVSVSSLIIVCLGFLSYRQSKTWRDSETLFTHMIDTLHGDPYEYDIYWRLGVVLYIKGEKERAATCFRKTLSIDPDNPTAKMFMAKIQQENDMRMERGSDKMRE